MFRDAYRTYSAAQALTADADSTNTLSHAPAGKNSNIGDGEPMGIFFKVDVAAAGGGTLQINLQDSADDSSFATILSTAAIAAATLVAGYRFFLAIPPGLTVRSFTKLAYDLTTMTGITISADLKPQSMAGTSGEDRYYPVGYTIS